MNPLTRAEARAHIAAETNTDADDWQVWRAPSGSIHEGAFYAQLKNLAEIIIDDQVVAVTPSGHVCRVIPVGNPVHDPTPLF